VTSHWSIFSRIKVTKLILTISRGQIKRKMSNLLIDLDYYTLCIYHYYSLLNFISWQQSIINSKFCLCVIKVICEQQYMFSINGISHLICTRWKVQSKSDHIQEGKIQYELKIKDLFAWHTNKTEWLFVLFYFYKTRPDYSNFVLSCSHTKALFLFILTGGI